MLEEMNFETLAILTQIDELQEDIKKAELINKKYDDLKKQIKEKMITIGKENNLEQLKWTTPNGTQITCSIGHKAEWEEEIVSEFNLDALIEKYPEIYKECFRETKHNKQIKGYSNDRLVITLPKGE